jgi:hypothetical protein
MNQSQDAATLALTGILPSILILACLLSWPISIAILALYRRAVRRSMSMRRGQGLATSRPASGPPPAGAAVPIVEGYADMAPAPEAERLARALVRRPWNAAAAYAAGGLTFALIVTLTYLVANGMTELYPIRFAVLFWMFAWPMVITTVIVAASVRSTKAIVVGAYFAGLAALSVLALARSSETTIGQIALAWVLYNLPATILMLTFLARRIRAIGPLVFVFTAAALTGAQLVMAFVSSSLDFLRAVVELSMMFDVGTWRTLVTLALVGPIIFGFVGWVALKWIRRQYEAKRISDESVTIDAIWILFTVSHGVEFAMAHPAWSLGALAAFVAYKMVSGWFLRSLRNAALEGHAPRLLLLRSFSIGKESERLLDSLEKHWRRIGSIQMIAGYDLASRTIEPHELLDFASGKLARRFIDGPPALEQRMAERDTAPDADGRYRVNDFFCYDNAWRLALTRLVGDSDVVLMDLRGFSRKNAGCVFEIEQLAALAPLAKVIFLVDARTDDGLLRETLRNAAARLAPDSPNSDMASRGVRVFRAGQLGAAMVRRLLAELSAATVSSTRTALHSSTP